jgi:drug/metabolite transporter (DMT)-like permease
MLGIPDASVWLAILLCLGSALLCVVYGIVNWNKGNGEKEGGDKK